MSWINRLRDAGKVAVDVGRFAGKNAFDFAMRQPELRERVENAQSLYRETKAQIEARVDSLEDELWVWINEMQEQAQRTHRQVQRARDSDDYYKILEIHRGASLSEVKAAWRRKMRQHHPDRYAYDPAAEDAAHRKAQEINLAYQELTALLTGREDRRSQ